MPEEKPGGKPGENPAPPPTTPTANPETPVAAPSTSTVTPPPAKRPKGGAGSKPAAAEPGAAVPGVVPFKDLLQGQDSGQIKKVTMEVNKKLKKCQGVYTQFMSLQGQAIFTAKEIKGNAGPWKWANTPEILGCLETLTEQMTTKYKALDEMQDKIIKGVGLKEIGRPHADIAQAADGIGTILAPAMHSLEQHLERIMQGHRIFAS